MKKSNEGSLFTEGAQDNKSIVQPSLEVMSFAEKCILPKPNVPLLLLHACRFHYRPLLYFKEQDVLLTSPTVLPLLTDNSDINIFGVMSLKLLFRLHLSPFNCEKLEQLPKSGWQAALVGASSDYKSSSVTVSDKQLTIPHQNVAPIVHRPQ